MLEGGAFCFLNETHALGGPEGWNAPGRAKLWLYNLHYFEDLCAPDAGERAAEQRALMRRWVAENPPGHGNGWEPYPISLRVVNWIKWSLTQKQPLEPQLQQSLAVQVRWLSRRLERHLLANHLFVNAKAMVMAGMFFEGREADRWRALGLRVLEREVSEQVLADGGHFERSPMYHALILEDILDLINASCAWPGVVDDLLVQRWRKVASSMVGWLGAMSHPDGGLSFFNDAAFGIAPTLGQLRVLAVQLGVAEPEAPRALIVLPQSGYVRAQNGPAVLLCDIAPVGPDYQPGHAHADTLSFELSLWSSRVIVNSGTSTYAPGPQRQWERSTRAHSTVELNGCDSSEVWGGFRVARRARPLQMRTREEAGATVVHGSHDGYRRLPGAPVHERIWELQEGLLRVRDLIRGPVADAIARYHLHPGVQVADDGKMTLPAGQALRFSATGGSLSVARSHWHPEFGISQPNTCLELAFDRSEATFELRW